MKLLIDTHVFLWWVWNSPELSVRSKEILSDDSHDVFLSMASMWELAIKISLGKLVLAKPVDRFISDHLQSNQFRCLDITIPHVASIASLPLHHRDPFDRLLIAQALVENMPILTADRAFNAYGVTRLW